MNRAISTGTGEQRTAYMTGGPATLRRVRPQMAPPVQQPQIPPQVVQPEVRHVGTFNLNDEEIKEDEVEIIGHSPVYNGSEPSSPKNNRKIKTMDVEEIKEIELEEIDSEDDPIKIKAVGMGVDLNLLASTSRIKFIYKTKEHSSRRTFDVSLTTTLIDDTIRRLSDAAEGTSNSSISSVMNAMINKRHFGPPQLRKEQVVFQIPTFIKYIRASADQRYGARNTKFRFTPANELPFAALGQTIYTEQIHERIENDPQGGIMKHWAVLLQKMIRGFGIEKFLRNSNGDFSKDIVFKPTLINLNMSFDDLRIRQICFESDLTIGGAPDGYIGREMLKRSDNIFNSEGPANQTEGVSECYLFIEALAQVYSLFLEKIEGIMVGFSIQIEIYTNDRDSGERMQLGFFDYSRAYEHPFQNGIMNRLFQQQDNEIENHMIDPTASKLFFTYDATMLEENQVTVTPLLNDDKLCTSNSTQMLCNNITSYLKLQMMVIIYLFYHQYVPQRNPENWTQIILEVKGIRVMFRDNNNNTGGLNNELIYKVFEKLQYRADIEWPQLIKNAIIGHERIWEEHKYNCKEKLAIVSYYLLNADKKARGLTTKNYEWKKMPKNMDNQLFEIRKHPKLQELLHIAKNESIKPLVTAINEYGKTKNENIGVIIFRNNFKLQDYFVNPKAGEDDLVIVLVIRDEGEESHCDISTKRKMDTYLKKFQTAYLLNQVAEQTREGIDKKKEVYAKRFFLNSLKKGMKDFKEESKLNNLFYDIETEFTGQRKPYLLCVVGKLYSWDIKKSFEGENCIVHFIGWLAEHIKRYCPDATKKKDVNLWSFNGGKFDNIYLLPYLDKFEIDGDIHNIKQLRFTLEGHLVKTYDFCMTMANSLDNLGKLFKVEHQKMNKQVLGTNDIEKIKLYCFEDCYCLKECYESFIAKMKSINIKCPTTFISAAHLAMLIYKNQFLNGISFDGLNGICYKHVLKSYFGGYTAVLKPRMKEGHLYDINSSYPHSMTGKIPIKCCNKYSRTTQFQKETKSGFCYLYEFNFVRFPAGTSTPTIPTRTKEGNFYFMNSENCWLWDFHIEYLLKEYPTLEYELKAFIKFEMGTPFDNWVNTFYAKKSEKGCEEVLKVLYKLLLNSLYGKMGQQSFPKKLYFKDINELNQLKDVGEVDIHVFDNKPTYEVTFNKEITNPTHIGALTYVASYITEKSRLHLFSTIHQIEKAGFEVYYCDTDSVFTNMKMEDRFADKVHSSELGKWKKECDIKRGKFFGSKTYIYETVDGKIVYKCKGISKKFMTPQDVEKLWNLDESSLEIHITENWMRKFGYVANTADEETVKHLRTTMNRRIYDFEKNVSYPIDSLNYDSKLIDELD